MIFHGERLFFPKFLEEKNIIAERHERNKFSSRTRSIVFTRQGWNFFQRKKEETLEKGSFARSDIELAGTVFSPPRSWNIFERGAPFRGTQRNSRRLSRVGKQRERESVWSKSWNCDMNFDKTKVSPARGFRSGISNLHVRKRAIISSFIQSEVNIIYFTLISKNFSFSFRANASPGACVITYIYIYCWKDDERMEERVKKIDNMGK